MEQQKFQKFGFWPVNMVNLFKSSNLKTSWLRDWIISHWWNETLGNQSTQFYPRSTQQFYTVQVSIKAKKSACQEKKDHELAFYSSPTMCTTRNLSQVWWYFQIEIHNGSPFPTQIRCWKMGILGCWLYRLGSVFFQIKEHLFQLCRVIFPD